MTSLLLLVVFAAWSWCGIVILSLSRRAWTLGECMWGGLLLGTVAASFVTYVLCCLIGLNVYALVLGILIPPLFILGIKRLMGHYGSAWNLLSSAFATWKDRGLGRCSGDSVIVILSLIIGVWGMQSIFGFDVHGNLNVAFPTVWADWALHLGTATSFAIGHNFPAQNILFAHEPMYYPFLPDFMPAELTVIGIGVVPALGILSGIQLPTLCYIAYRTVRRWGATPAWAIAAVAILLFGGSIGAVGVIVDAWKQACVTDSIAGHACAIGLLWHDASPQFWPMLWATIRAIPHVLTHQTHAYDGLQEVLTSTVPQNITWYTPFEALWLPQRTLVVGFPLALIALSLFIRRDGTLGDGILAGTIIGLLLLVHVESAIMVAGVMGLATVFVRMKRYLVAWIPFVLIGGWRVVQIAAMGHGALASGNQYPWIDIGWYPNPSVHELAAITSVWNVLGGYLHAVITTQFWVYWMTNTGIAVPGMVVCAVALLAGWLWPKSPIGRLFRKLSPEMRIAFVLAVCIFLVASCVVLQPWYYDNTKFLILWYFIGAGMLACLFSKTHALWTICGWIIVGTLVATGVVVMVRWLPMTPQSDAIMQEYQLVPQGSIASADQVAELTPKHAVFVTDSSHEDPIMIFAGRQTLVGYTGWLWSFGINYEARYLDEESILAGCPEKSITSVSCDVVPLLRRYNVRYVEINLEESDGAHVNEVWWTNQHLPIVTESQTLIVYNVTGLVK